MSKLFRFTQVVVLMGIGLAVAPCLAAENAPQVSSVPTTQPASSEGEDSSKHGQTSVIGDRPTTQPAGPGGRASFPAVGLSLSWPVGFELADQFHGLQQEATQSSVMVIRIPGPYDELVRGMTAENLQSRGVTLVSSQKVQIQEKPGLLLHVQQRAYDILFAKWMLVYADGQATHMVQATFPVEHQALLSGVLKEVVLSAKSEHAALPEPGSDVSFKLVPAGPLKLAPSLSKMLLYTKDGVSQTASPGDPMLVAAESFGTVVIQDKRAWAMQRMARITNMKVSHIESVTPVRLDDLEGYEIIGQAVENKTDTPVVIYNLILFEHDTYFLIHGRVGVQGREVYLPMFKAMAHSFARKK